MIKTLSSRPSFDIWHFLTALSFYCTESASEILKPCDVTGRYHAFPLNIYCSNFWNIQKYASTSKSVNNSFLLLSVSLRRWNTKTLWNEIMGTDVCCKVKLLFIYWVSMFIYLVCVCLRESLSSHFTHPYHSVWLCVCVCVRVHEGPGSWMSFYSLF